jgi:hypothetical protein
MSDRMALNQQLLIFASHNLGIAFFIIRNSYKHFKTVKFVTNRM